MKQKFFSRLRVAFGILLALATFAIIAEACQVPVFRFALERWEADPYTLTIVPGASGELTAAENEAIDFLQSTENEALAAANLKLRIDDSRESEAPVARMELSYPQKMIGFTIPPIWSGPVSMENARALVDSPARREIVKRLLAGDSATWILIESGDKEKDDAAAATMEASVETAKSQLKIPDGVMTREDAESVSNFAAINADDILQSEVPLRIDFSLIRVSRDDPAEALFRAMLLNIEDDLGEFEKEPMVFPVFGRGRVLEPLIGKGIHNDNVMEHSFYLCGACSCEVKDQNPGLDLLIAANWDAAIEGSEVVLEKILPPLEGVSALVGANDPETESTTPETEDKGDSAKKSVSMPVIWILLTCGVLIALVFGTALILRRR